MALDIILSQKAIDKLDLICSYLESEWSLAVRNNFLADISGKLMLLSKFPNLESRSSERPDFRQFVVSKHTSIYYMVLGETIEIITFQDNREDQFQ